ncbi:MAG: hypothetical protein A3G20_09925 [Acidobacteria bacterium RIFCSPLOWO2_12_FULL_59_11]|nr:MAG: hypothetical protein A3G20_09925 [Acidobacteria bacterium RIFCSPLOWO2_12_FULL_59_11]
MGSVVREARPDQIVFIGRGVARYLGNRLQDLGIPFTVLPQPNARLRAEKHLETFRRYDDLVNG